MLNALTVVDYCDPTVRTMLCAKDRALATKGLHQLIELHSVVGEKPFRCCRYCCCLLPPLLLHNAPAKLIAGMPRCTHLLVVLSSSGSSDEPQFCHVLLEHL